VIRAHVIRGQLLCDPGSAPVLPHYAPDLGRASRTIVAQCRPRTQWVEETCADATPARVAKEELNPNSLRDRALTQLEVRIYSNRKSNCSAHRLSK
jgi:hypothetical protein